MGIETSCDETSVAVVESGRHILANVIHSQVELHKEFGGVVPELAARDHLERLPNLLDLALERAGAKPADVDLIAVTRGPGLAGCLLVGVGVGEGLAAGWSRPLTGVNHLWGHIYAAMLTRPDLEPPLLGLVVSGAHSDLVRMPEHGRFEVIGRTRDDAAGEAFDKAARMLGLGYPGGPALDKDLLDRLCAFAGPLRALARIRSAQASFAGGDFAAASLTLEPLTLAPDSSVPRRLVALRCATLANKNAKAQELLASLAEDEPLARADRACHLHRRSPWHVH